MRSRATGRLCLRATLPAAPAPGAPAAPSASSPPPPRSGLKPKPDPLGQEEAPRAGGRAAGDRCPARRGVLLSVGDARAHGTVGAAQGPPLRAAGVRGTAPTGCGEHEAAAPVGLYSLRSLRREHFRVTARSPKTRFQWLRNTSFTPDLPFPYCWRRGLAPVCALGARASARHTRQGSRHQQADRPQ